MKINSHNEWDRLREIIVGSATGTSAVIEWHRSEPLNTKVYKEAIELCKKATPKKDKLGNDVLDFDPADLCRQVVIGWEEVFIVNEKGEEWTVDTGAQWLALHSHW